MDFYYGRMSGNSSRALLGLLEAGAQFTPHELDIHGGDNKSGDYLGINPMGKIPALADGAFRLWESNAINWYVAEKHPQAKLLPSTIEGRAAVTRWMHFQSAHVTPACIPVFRFTHAGVQKHWNTKGDAAADAAARKELARFLPVLEAQLDGRQWLEGGFSLADIAYVPHLALIADGGFDFAPYPRLAEWLGRLRSRPSWQKVREVMGF